MDYCPLHVKTTRGVRSCIVYFKPDYAGVRVLSLDGGGIRGIVELEVLSAVEQALGGKMPILAFFDLIVGTSTGGIIALGLGAKQWSLDRCVTEFVRLCDKAFTPREFNNMKGFSQATSLKHGSKYKTSPLLKSLSDVFEDEQLYGGPRKAQYEYDTKVAVTTTSLNGQTAALLANYSRQEESEPNYTFEFPHHLQTWEAAGATSAAPPFFKPFESYVGKMYLDGAIYYNNPVKVADNERKLLWPDVAESSPDIILSIGTGMNKKKIDEGLEHESIQGKNVRRAKAKSTSKATRFKESMKTKSAKLKPFKVISKYCEVLFNRIDKILDAEREWRQYRSDVLNGNQSQESAARYVRVNIDLKSDPPHLDEKKKLKQLQSTTKEALRTPQYRLLIENVACSLIASSFYFIKDDRIDYDGISNLWKCTGKIACRFEGKTTNFHHNLRSLGEYLRSQQGPNFQPYFSIKEKIDDPDSSKLEISQNTIEGMIARGEFRFNEPVNIAVASQLSQMTIFLSLCQSQRSEPGLYPISGFPRCLVSEDTLNATRLDKRAELIRQRRYNALPVANDPKVVTPSDTPVGDLAKSETKDSKRSLSPNKADDNTSLNAATPLQTKPSRLSLLTHRSSSRGAAPRASSLSTNTDAHSPSQTPDARGDLDDPSSAAAWAEKSPLAADEKQVSVEMLRSQSQDMLKATVVHAEQVMPSDGSSTTDENTSDDSEED